MTSMVFLLSRAEQHDIFGDFLPHSYLDEAEAKWGDTASWAETAERVLEYGIVEWQEIRAEQEDWEVRCVRVITSGAAPDGAEAMDLMEEQRLMVEKWFHPCSHAHHVMLVTTLLDDASFRARYEGLTHTMPGFLRDAVKANAARAERE
ncbi:TipAS antibiotic-recognition domain-containing protein [Stackebrandtia nassauensis]|uniref:TipAS antibiotic-recognition domain protein n=1 Tax=Stackebrandtia nassauensis (strain DSM 44728 / CIP 108903 / NRRL B-16338 / NBRC 102104 / LLR-40K-21) TaxID=446470 RepID=D3PX69_STANL|nr:TipAS antibiotic-recognition domain-containing protein [Stackebrandtia nassauensis]ADD41332.1 TipAS antibiotic-recognition domain protein [Stackebrandtia nassauensis DSM 44728]